MKKDLTKTRTDTDVAAFLRKVAQTPARPDTTRRGRLIFAMDATASRAPTWDQARKVQAAMFEEAARVGGIDIQLAHYRGQGEFAASRWCGDPRQLRDQMAQVTCAGGFTQIEKLLRHALAETRRQRVQAIVFIGDCVEESPDTLYELAGHLGLLGVPIFVFHEGGEPHAAMIFRELARLTQGAYCPFDTGSSQRLRDLLRAVALYAAGGRQALEAHGRETGTVAHEILRQLPAPK